MMPNSRFQPICWLKGVIFSQTSIRARWAIKRSRSICPIWPQSAPRAFTLALALPEAREDWLAPFSEGVFALADQYGCELIGGDTTAGPRTICITVLGDLNAARALRRDAARAGDDVWISGWLGDARLALGGW